MSLDQIIATMITTGRDLWDRGWTEANGGNISLRLSAQQRDATAALTPPGDWQALALAVPALAGERFVVTGTGRYLRNIELHPERNLGLIELDDQGAAYRILWGYEPHGGPTSELTAHLLSHAARMRASDGREHAVIHTHTPHLIALTYVIPRLDTALLSTILWRMHAECMAVFPNGVAFIPWMLAGSLDLAQATAAALERRCLALWEYHGMVGAGRNLDEAFGRIHVAEKTAGICLSALAAGGLRQALSDAQLRCIAERFADSWDQDLLTAWPTAP